MRKRAQVQFLCGSFRVSERRACRVLNLQRSVYYYRHRRDPQTELRVRLKDLAAARVRYGYERLHTLLVREGWQINLKPCAGETLTLGENTLHGTTQIFVRCVGAHAR